jgi:hydroxyacylglutathione hydrolase
MIKQLKDNLWELTFTSFGSNVYLIKLHDENILIDTGSFLNRKEIISSLKEIDLNPEDINKVILTHNHFDHTGNVKIFKQAKIYGSHEDFKSKKLNTAFIESFKRLIQSPDEELEVKNIQPLEDLNIPEFTIIKTPGHTKGSVVLYMPKEKILFSGDTIFNRGIGRTDLPNSQPEKMQDSLDKVNALDVDLLCPGHYY